MKTVSRTIALEENWSQNPRLTLTQTLTRIGGQFSKGEIVWSPNPKTNPDLEPNPNPNRGQLSSGVNCPDTMKTNSFARVCWNIAHFQKKQKAYENLKCYFFLKQTLCDIRKQ